MPNAAIVAAALTDHSARSFALWVGGVDWLKQPGTAGNLYGVPLETIEVTENGPGGVSAMTFSLEDPLNVVALPTAGSEVLFMDLTDDHPEFLGFVQAIDVKPHEGQQGRWLDVTAVGIEVLLDWLIVPSLALPAGISVGTAWQSIVAAAGANLNVAIGGAEGTQATPITGDNSTYLISAYTVTALTLREALRQATAQVSLLPGGANITVDFTRGLRAWRRSSALQHPDDYLTLTVDDTAHTNGSADLHYTLTPADIVRGVQVIGASGVNYGLFTDGSGMMGAEAILNDSTITSAGQAAIAAQQYLSQFTAQLRASLHLETFSHGTTKYQAGSNVALTDAPVGLNAVTFAMGSIRKRYNGTTEEWDVSFGGLAPSVTNVIRRQTRATLS